MRVVILGNGIAGVTAARFIRKQSKAQILLVSDETDEFFSRTALMYIYMGHMREKDTRPYEPWFWDKNNIQRKRAKVILVDFSSKNLVTDTGENISYDVLILATGSISNKFGWPGQDLNGVGGLYHLQDLANIEQYSNNLQRAVIVGGGLIGIEMAEMFHSRHIPVSFLVREQSFWNAVLPAEESAMITRHILEHNIDLRLDTNLNTINDDGTGRCNSVTTSKGETISCGFVGLTAGVSPNIAFLKGGPLEIGRGVLVDEFLRTNIPDVYAIGDCAEMRTPQPGRRPIEAVWYCGRMMGETVAYTITGKPKAYDPGIWFNSAKFFDIEYQVYGDIPLVPGEGVETLYWEHPGGKNSIRINYRSQGGAVTGFNLMGVRYRQEVCQKWIADGVNIEIVLQHLGAANFDPEFFMQYEQQIVDIYNQKHSKNISLLKKRKLSNALEWINN